MDIDKICSEMFDCTLLHVFTPETVVCPVSTWECLFHLERVRCCHGNQKQWRGFFSVLTDLILNKNSERAVNNVIVNNWRHWALCGDWWHHHFLNCCESYIYQTGRAQTSVLIHLVLAFSIFNTHTSLVWIDDLTCVQTCKRCLTKPWFHIFYTEKPLLYYSFL